jgi:RNA polymerase sigma factor (sigma-70 family)
MRDGGGEVIRVLVVDDHASFRQPLAFMLERQPDLTVVAQAGTVAEARTKLARVDVAIVDLGLPDGDGIDIVREVRAANPHCLVLVLTAHTDQRYLARAVEAGAAGVLNKSASIDEIIGAVLRLSSGEELMSPREVVDLLRLAGRHREQDREARSALESLTPREREVLQALADGLKDKEIAERLNVSTETARSHMVSVLRKLGLDSRLQALVFAIRHGVVKIH